MGREFELKYKATPELLAQIQAAFPGDYETLEMRTDYYDTPDADLAARKWMIRCRRENGRAVCTLKTPGDGLGRHEWELESDNIAAAVPALARESGWSELEEMAKKGLFITCGAAFTRRCRILELGRTQVELALDQGVFLGAGKQQPFAELELELKRGSEETVLLFARKLQGDFGLKTEHKSKAARARALAKEG